MMRRVLLLLVSGSPPPRSIGMDRSLALLAIHGHDFAPGHVCLLHARLPISSSFSFAHLFAFSDLETVHELVVPDYGMEGIYIFGSV